MEGMEQGAFDTMLRQALGALTQEQSASAVAQDAEARGPDAAIAEAVDRVMEGVVTAAQKAGVDLPQEAVKAAAVTTAGAMVSMMAQADGTDDPKALLQAVIQRLGIGEETAPEDEPGPEDSPADEAEDATEMEDDESEQPMQRRPRGALMMG
jgi:hypothetical protein